ncbi:MAG: 4'-phosphopantetheinyl transferase superfamily protein [Clostridia bacterium]|nr:4'-phosphopantetheinyl transferase superfamily protein [Clostridia bacterium]
MLYMLNTASFDDSFMDEIKAAEKKIFSTDRLIRGNKHSLCGRILLGYILKNRYGIASFSYSYGENGKPYLKNEDIFFSISHSGKYVLCCVSDSEIGCDIEEIRDYNPKVGKRFFTSEEYELLSNKETEDINFAKLWTLKESILKKEGTGISGGLDTYCFADFIDKESFDAYGCSFYSYRFGAYMVSVCGEKADYGTEIVSEEKITEFIRTLN